MPAETDWVVSFQVVNISCRMIHAGRACVTEALLWLVLLCSAHSQSVITGSELKANAVQ